jgi:hypothetical protein
MQPRRVQISEEVLEKYAQFRARHPADPERDARFQKRLDAYEALMNCCEVVMANLRTLRQLQTSLPAVRPGASAVSRSGGTRSGNRRRRSDDVLLANANVWDEIMRLIEYSTSMVQAGRAHVEFLQNDELRDMVLHVAYRIYEFCNELRPGMNGINRERVDRCLGVLRG